MSYNYNVDDYIVLSSSCKTTQGKNRTLICDYLRSELYFIPNDYNQLLIKINRNKIKNSLKIIDPESLESFYEFVDFLRENEIIFFTNNLKQFPERKILIEETFYIKDAILEIDTNCFDEKLFSKNINELNQLKCNDIQLRILTEINYAKLICILNFFNPTSINYVEIHLPFSKKLNKKKLFSLIEQYPILSHIYVYSSPMDDIAEFKVEKENFYPLLFGNIYYVKTKFDNGNCCGNISINSLNFETVNVYDELKLKNGCLYKKVTIDKNGKIKNCPSLNNDFGNLKKINISDVINSKEFMVLGDINKDKIDVCKECEFRYNCTDCRAFINDSSNIYSKPLKCGYNINTFIWEDWSKNPLRDKGKTYDEI